jgi:hypothetical protein
MNTILRSDTRADAARPGARHSGPHFASREPAGESPLRVLVRAPDLTQGRETAETADRAPSSNGFKDMHPRTQVLMIGAIAAAVLLGVVFFRGPEKDTPATDLPEAAPWAGPAAGSASVADAVEDGLADESLRGSSWVEGLSPSSDGLEGTADVDQPPGIEQPFGGSSGFADQTPSLDPAGTVQTPTAADSAQPGVAVLIGTIESPTTDARNERPGQRIH